MKKYLVGTALVMALLVLFAGSVLAELPESLQIIESGAFEGDTALKGVFTLPECVTEVSSRAFAVTGLHALIVPEGCRTLAADVLAGGNAAYVTLSGGDTAVSATALTDVPYLFAPEGGSACEMTGFYSLESLCVIDGLFFSLGQEEAIPLCAVDTMEAGSTVCLPKLVNDMPVLSLDTLVLRGCEESDVSVPSYLTIPEGMTVSTYDAMSVSAPVPSVKECLAGDSVTWTTEVTGAYGDVSYIWLFNTDGVASSLITAEPQVTWTPTQQGLCIATVTAVDALDDRASASGAGVTVGEPIPMYRALLIGNTYPGTDNELGGCDTDVYAMRTLLNSMPGMDYAITTQLNVSSTGIQSAIASTFADARSCDVSLFYFSGHGTSAGSLVGVGNSTVSVGALRNWLDQIPGTKIVIIDCCFSGMMIGKSDSAASPSSFTSAFISGFSYFTKANNLANNGYIVMTACTKEQQSSTLTDGTISFGAFTYGVCYGSGYDEWNQVLLGSMPADVNGDGQITLGEAYSVAVDRVAWLTEMVPTLDQSAQYYGDTSFVLWSK